MSPYRPRRRQYTRNKPAPAEGCRSRRTTAGRRQTPGPGRRSFRRLRMSRCELADPIAEPRRRLIGAALAPHQAFHAGLEFEHLLTGRTVVEMRLHLRSEERRVGKECRSRWSSGHGKKKKK